MPTPGNSINEATTGICGFTGTAFTGTAATAHAVMVGGSTSSTLTNIAATANTGAVLQNNSGADPSYSTATYPSTTAANQIIYSTATNTVSALTSSKGTVYLSADVTNVTGDGTDYTIAFDTVFYDSNSDFNTSTHNLVIPRTGFYLLIGNATFNSGFNSSNTSARMYISIPSHAIYVASNNPTALTLSGGTTYAGSYIAQLNANDNVNLHILAGGSTKTAGLAGGNGNLQTFFSWHFIG